MKHFVIETHVNGADHSAKRIIETPVISGAEPARKFANVLLDVLGVPSAFKSWEAKHMQKGASMTRGDAGAGTVTIWRRD